MREKWRQATQKIADLDRRTVLERFEDRCIAGVANRDTETNLKDLRLGSAPALGLGSGCSRYNIEFDLIIHRRRLLHQMRPSFFARC